MIIRNHPLNANSSQSQSVRPHVDDKKLRCWFFRDSHKTSACTVLKATPVDDQRQLVKKNKLCFNCLSSDQMITQCRSKHSCKVSGSNKPHHTLLHQETSTGNSKTLTKNDPKTQTLNTGNTPPNTESLPPQTANSETPGASDNNQNAFNSTDNISTLLQIVPVITKNGDKSVKANVLLDSGSDVTLINKDLASKLNLSGDRKVLNICNAMLWYMLMLYVYAI